MNTLLVLLAACTSDVPPPTVEPVVPSPVVAPEVVVPEVVPVVVVPDVVPAAAVPTERPEPRAPEPVAAPIAPEAAVVAPEPAPPAAADYTLVPRKNALYVVVKYERGTLGANLAHDHVIVATSYSGTVHWDPADPSTCRIAVDVPTGGLQVDPPGARAAAGLEGTPPEDDQPKIEANFNGSRQLDSERFPTLTFRSTSCAAAGEKTKVTGDLAIHGVSRSTTVVMDLGVGGAELSAKGRFTAAHDDFGMSPFSAAMGAVRNAEPLDFVIDLRARR